MRTLDLLAESFLGETVANPRLSLLKGGKGGGTAKKKPADDDDDDDLDDDDDDDDEEEEDDDEEEEDDDDELAGLTEDELREKLRETQERLSRSSGANAKKRKRIRQLNDQIAGKGGTSKPKPKAKTKDGDEEVDADALRAEAKAEATTAANARIVKAEARGALKAAGIEKAQVGRLVGMLKLDDIDVDDDGEVDEDALEEAIDDLKKEWPQLFPKSTARKRTRVAGGRDNGGNDAGPRKKFSATELQVAAALGKKPGQLSR